MEEPSTSNPPTTTTTTSTSFSSSSSILPFLPYMSICSGGLLEWPSQIAYALKALARGPASSQVLDSESLCDFINDLREQFRLPLLNLPTANGISLYFGDLISRATARHFFETVVPGMANLVLRLPELLNEHFHKSVQDGSDCISTTLRVLPPQHAGLVFLSQELVATLLACALFCIYPMSAREEARLPHFNFDGLFSGLHNTLSSSQEHKINCLLNYFTRVCNQMPQGMVSYERKVLPRHACAELVSPISEPDEQYWKSSELLLCPLQVFETGTIEDQPADALEVDFANRYLGGGVLSQGCVQEEIRFVISPELIAGMLFIPVMHRNEAIEIRGAERFSRYGGYGASFSFQGDYVDNKPRDLLGRRKTSIVAIDALMYPGKQQYKNTMILRETNKAFCGFLDHAEFHTTGLASQWGCEKKEQPKEGILASGMHKEHSNDVEGEQRPSELESINHELSKANVPAIAWSSTTGIATGNWGCGAFGGDVELKSFVQWIAASQAGRPFLHYYTFGESHGQRFQQLANWIRQERWLVGELWGLLAEYGERRLQGECHKGIFDWILPSSASRPASQPNMAGLQMFTMKIIRH